ncbi:hypothetical protein EDB80DRAFT_900462 [Ilyonectria destructans]|nr:hypothetical protein EDB80DRAFT_900462 [Ilyonectria destructans]
MKGDVTLTRSYSDGSAGKLSSGKGSVGPPHTLERLLSEFAEHRKLANRTHPTSLVSASDRIIDSLKRAFNKYYEDGEHPDQIWIVFIRIPYGRIQTTKVHSARKLAEECQHPEPSKFTHEYLFEWAIPQEYVVHSVSVETLIHRGLKMDQFRCISYEPAWHRCDKSRLPPLSLLRKAMADEYIRHCYDRWEV